MMRFRIVPQLFLFISVVGLKNADGRELPEILQKVLRADTAYQSVSCKIDIELDVPGLSMPRKEVEFRLEKGKEPEIRGKGITILPRHGILGQYHDFLELDCQVIPIRENGDTIVYKVVSLDKRSDWVTVDLAVTRSETKIHWMLISTRKYGEYLVRHFYGPESEFFPEKSEIGFEAVPLKLPLKFLGRQEGVDFLADKREPVTGKVVLRYDQISWTKMPE